MGILKDFIVRNKPIFAIGAITALVFLLIIAVGEEQNSSPSQLPILKKVTESISDKLDSTNGANPQDQNYQQNTSTRESTTYVESKNEAKRLTDLALEQEAAEMERLKKFEETSQMTPAQVDAKYGALIITYTQEGFTPKQTNGYINQLVIWNNDSNKPVIIRQITPSMEAFNEPVIIPVGGRFEMRLTNTGPWAYIEDATNLGGIIMVQNAIFIN
ncbi:hypothetical protein H6802_01200 [Candidatus Nomurabacteria bacterium]|uniref:Uncharacterized protein n=1 Tax=candidate division WWE3 bacterium TaxID=2053526 RepID=A0A955IVP9_UNCKA|nr:hypothetical protein [candidate division WWE3 bacterium]MCB9823557.1 hypothetical protein [Candidatus Nomurabacteria bacterium]MCB9827352.1 hypothetical protein [Candidatus Nomurabacteria bacterium]HXK52906.1 hypothetical protein [bacterium]